jgi:periplasmic divalent cation tolerance protein
MGQAAATEYVVLLITTEAGEAARLISRVLLEQRLAACVNIIPGINSLFWWQDKIEAADESLLLVKTKASLVADVVQTVKEIHSSDVPEVIALPVIDGNRDYLDWLYRELAGGR